MGLIGNLFGGAQLKKASRDAAATQNAALQGGIDTLNKQFDTTSGYYQPYRQGGEQAFGQYGDLLGLHGGDVQQSAIDALRASPYFQSLYGQGQEAVLQNASATGGLRGGDTQHSLYDLGNQTLAQTIQQQLSNLGGTAQNFGMGSVNALGQFGAQNAGGVADLLNAQGQAKAQDILTRGQISNSMWSGLGSALIGGAGALLTGGTSLLGGGGGGLLGSLGSKLGGGGSGGLLGSLFHLGSGSGGAGGGGFMSGLYAGAPNFSTPSWKL